jgi:hypothetical protein
MVDQRLHKNIRAIDDLSTLSCAGRRCHKLISQGGQIFGASGRRAIARVTARLRLALKMCGFRRSRRPPAEF